MRYETLAAIEAVGLDWVAEGSGSSNMIHGMQSGVVGCFEFLEFLTMVLDFTAKKR